MRVADPHVEKCCCGTGALILAKPSFANLEAPSLELVADISAQRGPWAALLEPTGFREVGHWVVVDGVSDDEVILIRDPDGSAYGMPVTEFLE